VEQRHDDEAAVALADPEAVGVGEGVQVVAAVRVGDALGVAGGAGGVAHRRGVVLVHVLGPVEALRLAADELGVVVHPLDVRHALQRRPGVGVDRAVDDDLADRSQVGEQLRERRGEGVVDDDHLAAAVGGDVDQLLGEQPDVEGVEHRTHRRDGQVGGEVLGVVPHERGDALVTGDPEAAQGVRQLRGLRPEVGEADPAATVRGPRDDLLVGVEGRPVAQELRDQQRCCLHGALHGGERVKQSALSLARAEEPSQTCNAGVSSGGERH
jgi:hypothetical protein